MTIRQTEIAGGIIPARAGFTFGARDFRMLRKDHPRSRGVYFAICATVIGSFGSSPLARGLHYAEFNRYDRDGIIPARAGFTFRFILHDE